MHRDKALRINMSGATLWQVAFLGSALVWYGCSIDDANPPSGTDTPDAATSSNGEAATGGSSGTGGTGGGDGDAGPSGPSLETVTATIGAEGGTLDHPGGAQLNVPAGALTEPVELSIQGALAPEAGVLGATALGQAFVLGPEGQTFLLSVTVAVPFDADLLPSGTPASNARVLIAPRDSTSFTMLATTADLDRGTLEAATTHFSVVVPAAPPGEPLDITTASLPDGMVGEYYGPVHLTVTGGIEPVTWSLADGSIPQGMRFNEGMFSGTPQSAGMSTFTVRVTDDEGNVLEKAMTLTVLPASAGETDAGVGEDAGTDGGVADDGPDMLYADYELELVAVDDTYLYFLQSGGSLSRLPLSGGAPELMSSFSSAYEKVQFLDPYFYYATGSTLVRQHKSGGTEETVGSPPNPYALTDWTVVGDTAWISYFNQFATVPVTGGTLTTVINPGGNLVACDGTHIVFARFSDGWGTWVASAHGGSEGFLFSGAPISGVLDGGILYYASADGIFAVDPTAAGGEGEVGDLIVNVGSASRLRVSGDDLLFIDSYSEAKHVPKTGGTPVTLGPAGNGSILADATHIYVASMYPDAGIYRVER